MSYDIGDRVTLSVVIADAAGDDADPVALQFVYAAPSGLPASSSPAGKGSLTNPYIYDTDDEIVRDSEGHFHIELPITTGEHGRWMWRWQSFDAEGSPTGACEGEFEVERSLFS